jgi:lactoylglutathione lyase
MSVADSVPCLECVTVTVAMTLGGSNERARSQDDHLVDRRSRRVDPVLQRDPGHVAEVRDGAHFAALDGGPVTLALATAVDHPIPGQVVVGIKTADVDAAAKAIEASGGGIVKGPYDDAHERHAVVYDNKGNGLVFYKPLAR